MALGLKESSEEDKVANTHVSFGMVTMTKVT